MFTLRSFQVRLKTSQPFHGVIHARDSRDNACLTYGSFKLNIPMWTGSDNIYNSILNMRMLTGSANINDRCHPDQERGEWRHSSPSTSWHPRITPHTAAYSTTMWVHLEWPHIINCATNTAEGLIVSATTHNPYPWLRNMCSVAVYWEQNILATIASVITKYWVLCHETRWVRT